MEVAKLYEDQGEWPVFSAETFPTENFRPPDQVYNTIEELIPHGIKVATVTWGALGSPRGGTIAIARNITEKLNIPTVVHFTIQGKTIRIIENYLRGMHLDGQHNVLVLGGDPPGGQIDYVAQELRHKYASEFIEQIVQLNKGYWLDKNGHYGTEGVKTHFGIGVAGFPDIHPDDVKKYKSLDDARHSNIVHLKHKVDMGARYIIEQMIFDPETHFRYRDDCEAIGITVPIIPGITPFTRYAQVSRFLGDELRIYMPKPLMEKLDAASEEDQEKIARDYTAEMVQKLLDSGVPGIHFYCMNKSQPTIDVLSQVTY